MDTFKDRRQYPRSAKPVKYRQLGEPDRVGEGTTLDISAGGMRARVPRTIERRTTFEIEVELPDGWLAIEARVAWSIAVEGSGYEVGLQFPDMSPEDRARLQDGILSREF